jgi:hypothetical protein
VVERQESVKRPSFVDHRLDESNQPSSYRTPRYKSRMARDQRNRPSWQIVPPLYDISDRCDQSHDHRNGRHEARSIPHTAVNQSGWFPKSAGGRFSRTVITFCSEMPKMVSRIDRVFAFTCLIGHHLSHQTRKNVASMSLDPSVGASGAYRRKSWWYPDSPRSIKSIRPSERVPHACPHGPWAILLSNG